MAPALEARDLPAAEHRLPADFKAHVLKQTEVAGEIIRRNGITIG